MELDMPLPDVSKDEMSSLIRHYYDVEQDPRFLGGERDINTEVAARDGTRLVIKLANAADTHDTLEYQTAILAHLSEAAPELPAPRPYPTRKGEVFEEVEIGAGTRHFIRAMTRVEGKPISERGFAGVDLIAIGDLAARVDQALASFFHPAQAPVLAWDVMRAETLRQQTACIADLQRRTAAEAAFDRFVKCAIASLRSLPHQVIHCDLNGDNILVDDSGGITGVVDFGDAVFAPYLVEICVTASKLAEAHPDDPLGAACKAIGGYAARRPIDPGHIGLILPTMLGRMATLVTIQAWRETHAGEQAELLRGGLDAACGALDALLAVDPDEAHAAFQDAIRAGGHGAPAPRPPKPRLEELLERRMTVLGPHMKITYPKNPLYSTRAEGVWIYDDTGRPLLDAYNNVPHVGHAHPAVVEAMTEQARRINTNTRYIYEAVLDYGERLAATMPEGLEACIFVNSGSEANDVAWRIAQIVTGNSGALVLEDAYHGCTQATADLSPFRWPEGYRPDHVRTVPAPDTYRGPFGEDHNDPAEAYAEEVSCGMHELGTAGHGTAAYLLCTAYCTNGILDAPRGYLPKAAERVRSEGGLLIADEVQFGFGRPGRCFWGFQMFDPDFVPDMIVMGKPIANGMPIGAIVTTREIMERFRERQYFFSTFGGNPVATAAGLAVLEVLEREELPRKAAETGDYVLARLRELQESYACIGRVSGRGLFFGLDIVKDRESKAPDAAMTARLQARMRELGVLIGTEGLRDNFLKIRPPMPFGIPHADLMLQALEQALAENSVLA